MKQGLTKLCREGTWYAPAQTGAIIEENRAALKTL